MATCAHSKLMRSSGSTNIGRLLQSVDLIHRLPQKPFERYGARPSQRPHGSRSTLAGTAQDARTSSKTPHPTTAARIPARSRKQHQDGYMPTPVPKCRQAEASVTFPFRRGSSKCDFLLMQRLDQAQGTTLHNTMSSNDEYCCENMLEIAFKAFCLL